MTAAAIPDLPPNWMEYDLRALEENIIEVQRIAGSGVRLIGSVKGDGYGHGVAQISAALQRQDAYSLMTGRFEDVRRIREAGVDTPIAMFVGYTPEQIPRLLDYGVTPTITDLRGAEVVSRTARSHVPIYVKVDMGLGRLGIGMSDAVRTIQQIARLRHLEIECVYTHLPFTDPEGRDWARERLCQFDDILARLEKTGLDIPVTQARASSCIVAGLQDNCNAVCVGHLLYGLVPVSSELCTTFPFRPVLRAVKTRLVHLRRQSASLDIPTGKYYSIPSETLVGVTSIGIADGMPIPQPNRPLNMLLQGETVRVIGVSLEHTILDLQKVDDPQAGNEVVVIGRCGSLEVTLQDFAAAVGRSELEVLSGFSGRLSRVFTTFDRQLPDSKDLGHD